MDDEGNNARVVISAKVSRASADGWKAFCRENGVSMAAVLEVAGRMLGAGRLSTHDDIRVRMVDDARAVDIARRSRKPE